MNLFEKVAVAVFAALIINAVVRGFLGALDRHRREKFEREIVAEMIADAPPGVQIESVKFTWGKNFNDGPPKMTIVDEAVKRMRDQ